MNTTQKAEWTVLAYIAAHNNLEDMGQRSLEQILGVGSTPELKLAALLDRGDGATRYIAGDPGQAAVEEPLGEFDSGSPAALLETVQWAFGRCPAKHYGLVLWSHGSGWQPEEPERGGGAVDEEPEKARRATPRARWLPQEVQQVARQTRGDDAVSATEAKDRAGRAGNMALFRTSLAQILKPDDPVERAICFDDGSAQSLDTVQLEQVMSEIHAFTQQSLDLLGMDACLMATLEVAYQIRKHVNYVVASEELVPGRSWPYDTILEELRAEPGMAARDLAARVVKHYIAYYTQNPPKLNYGDVTKVALDLSRIGELQSAALKLASALLADKAQATELATAQSQTQDRESVHGRRYYNKFNYHLWDLGTLADSLLAVSQSGAVKAAARALGAALQPGGAVIAEGHDKPWFTGLGGVSIYLVSPGVQRITPHYAKMALAKDARWKEMLDKYHKRWAM